MDYGKWAIGGHFLALLAWMGLAALFPLHALLTGIMLSVSPFVALVAFCWKVQMNRNGLYRDNTE